MDINGRYKRHTIDTDHRFSTAELLREREGARGGGGGFMGKLSTVRFFYFAVIPAYGITATWLVMARVTTMVMDTA